MACGGNYMGNDGRAVSCIGHTTVGMAAVKGTDGMLSFKSCQVLSKAFVPIPYAGSVCRRNAELHEFPRSLQSILTDAVPCYLGQEPTKKYGWTALSIFATAVPSDTLSNRLRHHCQSLHRVKRTSQLLCWLLLLAPSESTLGKDCYQNVGALVLF